MADLAGAKIAYVGFSGTIDSAAATNIAKTLNVAVNDKYDGVYLLLSSVGGYVADAVYIYNHIRSLPISVTTHNTGIVASAANCIFVGGSPRFASRNSTFMIHPVTMGQPSSMAWQPLQATLDAALANEKLIDGILRERTKIAEDVLSARTLRDIYISAEDAVKCGIIDDVHDFTLPPGHQIFQI
ncbi:MAG: ATP-dependent Clp protease proteolytic subunit [Nevskia sp.]|nr:ATP-dependent Clp protease proteolytic subunit [Nevskia sp.]